MARDRLTSAVHIWSAPVPGRGTDLAAARRLLTAGEIARADRFRVDRPRRCFLTARAVLRRLLGAYCDRPPEAIRFSYGDNGKPDLTDRAVSFNISHSGDHIVVAITAGGDVGIDIEVIRDIESALPIARKFFSDREADHLESLEGTSRQRAFFHLWTAKEAYLKAVGTGLATPLREVEVDTDAESHPRILSIGGRRQAASGWSLLCPDIGQGTLCTLAFRGDRPSAELFRFPDDFPGKGLAL